MYRINVHVGHTYVNNVRYKYSFLYSNRPLFWHQQECRKYQTYTIHKGIVVYHTKKQEQKQKKTTKNKTKTKTPKHEHIKTIVTACV